MLAGVSPDYYARLEQGRARNVSEQVLTAVAEALQLDDLERRHLIELVRPAAGPGGNAAVPAGSGTPLRARAALRSMLDALDPVPAMIYGPCLDVLAANRMGKVLIHDFDEMAPAERNMVHWMFLHPNARRVYPDWSEIAAQLVAILRVAAGNAANEARLAVLVGELTTRSTEFADYWADYRVYQHTYGPKRFHHDAVGDFTLNYETLQLPADPGLSLIIYSADRGSPSAEKLAALAQA